MSKRGPKPKPLAELRLAGGFRRDRHALCAEPKASDMPAPACLPADLADLYADLAGRLRDAGMGADTYAHAAVLLADALADWQHLRRVAAETEPVAISARGGRSMEPAWLMKSMARKALLSLLTEFGMTPSSIRNVQTVQREEVDELEALLAGHG